MKITKNTPPPPPLTTYTLEVDREELRILVKALGGTNEGASGSVILYKLRTAGGFDPFGDDDPEA